MKIYLYLGTKEMAETWVNGGEIPIDPASKYLAKERIGIMTPDENLIDDTPVPLESLRDYGYNFGDDPNIKSLTFTGNKTIILGADGVHKVLEAPNMINVSRYREDGLVLCFCNHLSSDTALRFENKTVCVEILDIEQTKKEIDKQLEVIGQMKKCEYTDNHQRSHFLKHEDDSWQDEYRIFWESQRDRTWVTIPSGTAKIVWSLESLT